jgi:DNA polymerase I-like protein with 3'-5' exonuclease and polymerase domains
MDGELSKLFKDDYSFNDHGIYYDVFRNSNFDLDVHNLEEKLKKLQAKQKKKYKDEVQSQIYVEESCYNTYIADVAFILVPAEPSTMKRDWQRFMEYEKFVDPVGDCRLVIPSIDFEEFTYILDIETTGLDFDQFKITMLGIKALGINEVSIIKNPGASEIKRLLKKLEGKTVIGHNLIFDLSWLMYVCGYEFAPNISTVDTMLLAHVAGERQLSLKHLSMMYGNFKGRRNTLTADESYLVEDLLSTECLYNKFQGQLTTFAGQLVCNAVKTFSEAKVNGVVLDQNRLFDVRDDYRKYDTPKYDFNVDSNRDLAAFLVSNGVKLTEKTERGDLKVDQKTLENFKDNEVVAEYLDYQKELNIYQKFIKPYCELQQFTIRPNIMLFGTETGRLACSNPNVQQIPNRSLFKDIFRSRFGQDGVIGSIDLDQAELRIAALLSGDEVYANALLSNDFHKLVASKTFGKAEKDVSKQERFVAKSVNFGGVLYGGSAKGIATRIKVDPEVVAKVQEWYKEEFVKLTNWIDSQKDLAVKTNEVTTLFGRTRKLETVHARKMRWDEKRRIGVNTAVQSVASDVMLYIVTRLSTLLRKHQLRSKILFPVHDELLIDIHRSELEQVVELLKQAFKDVLKTPLGKLDLAATLPISGVLEYGQSWLYVKNEKYQPEGKVKISSLED